jgi:hypothetical protein
LFAGGVVVFFGLIPHPNDIGLSNPDDDEQTENTSQTIEERASTSAGEYKFLDSIAILSYIKNFILFLFLIIYFINFVKKRATARSPRTFQADRIHSGRPLARCHSSEFFFKIKFWSININKILS